MFHCYICIAALVNVKLSNGEWLVKGRKLTSFTNEEEDIVKLSSVMPFMLQTALTDHGGDFVAAAAFQNNVQDCERVLTGQNPASSTSLAQLIVKKMKELKFH